MRFANDRGRLAVIIGDGVVDVQNASNGRFSAEPHVAYEKWDELRAWAESADLSPTTQVHLTTLGAPSPYPRQVFAIGLNYSSHAEESGFSVPKQPSVFTKFVSAVTGPTGEITIPDGHVDWEIELVAVIGRHAYQVSAGEAWSHVAGLTVGQDLSERQIQLAGSVPQFSLGKSFPGFAPTGPYLVTVDEFDDPTDLELGCSINGESVQRSRTCSLNFSVPELVAHLSGVCPLLPGDLIFTGTPAGVGQGRSPQRFLTRGDELVSYVCGIGEMRHTFV